MAKPPPKINRADLPGHFFSRWVPDTRPVRTKPCDYPGCEGVGEYRAPARHYRDDVTAAPLNVIDEKTRDASHWFCLDHVKQFNASWDYYEGLSETEIEQAIRFDGVWNRPTWPFGQWGPKKGGAKNAPPPPLREEQPREESEINEAGAVQILEAGRSALAELGLQPPVDFAVVQKRYRQLVKQHHPDMKSAEGVPDGAAENDTIRRLNAAFTLLKTLYRRRKA